MTAMASLAERIAHLAVHLLLVLVAPPLLIGLANRVKARFAGRTGAPLLQPWHDLLRLWRKSSVFSRTTTWIFRAGPVVGVATALLAAAFVPLGGHPAAASFAGDVVLVAYLLALGRFFTVAAALDTGSAFEGMGGAREAAFACLAEPALFLGLLVLVRRSGSFSLDAMLGSGLGGAWTGVGASLVVVLVSLVIVLLVESSRVPFDDPNTHLELTMIHEVMVLDHSGPSFAMVLYGAWVKMFVLVAVVVRIALPVTTGNAWLDWAVFIAGMAALAALIGVVESVMARLRLVQVPKLLVAACLLSAFGLLLAAR